MSQSQQTTHVLQQPNAKKLQPSFHGSRQRSVHLPNARSLHESSNELKTWINSMMGELEFMTTEDKIIIRNLHSKYILGE